MSTIKTLIVDDSKFMLAQAEHFLGSCDDIDIYMTTSPKEVLNIISKRDIDVIVSDYNMPNMNGIQLFERIREEFDKDIPFIIFTGKGEEKIASRALNIGADRYLLKEGDLKERYKMVENAIKDEYERYRYELELEKSRKELKHQKEMYKTLVESSFAGIIISDYEDNIRFVNEKFSDMLGYKEDELIGKNLRQFVPEDDKDKLDAGTERRKEGYPGSYETKIEHKDGKTIHVIIHASPYSMELDGKQGIIGVITDITERKEIEERDELLHSLLRHDIGNMIQVIQGYAQILEEDIENDSLEQMVKEIDTATNKAQDLIQKTRTLRKLDKEQKSRPVNIHTLLDSILSDYKDNPEKITLDYNYDDDDFLVEGGPLLKEAFTNIIENGIKHSKGNKMRATVKKENDIVVTLIEDDGKGIPDEQEESVFDEGYKKGNSAGSGLGLYLVKSIIEKYGGSIKIDDSELGGALFEIKLKNYKTP